MNILEICSGKSLNGAAYSTLLLTRELASRGHRVSMACLPYSWMSGQLADDPVEVIESDLHRWPPDELRRIAAAVRRRRIDVVHTHMSRAHLFGVLLRILFGVPCVATAHCRKFQPHWMLNDHVIAVSEATRRFHVRFNLVRPRRIETVYNFVDPRWRGEVPQHVRARIRAELGAGESSALVASVGQISQRKGQVYLVRAMPKILHAVPEAKLLLVGGTTRTRKYLNQVEAVARELGVADHVVWTGMRDDVEELLAAVDLLAHAALEEPLSRVLLEAMTAGLPIVATDVTGTRECITPGETGVLVPPEDPDALAEAIVALLGDPARRHRLGRAAQRQVARDFSPQTTASRTEAVFERVVSRRKAA